MAIQIADIDGISIIRGTELVITCRVMSHDTQQLHTASKAPVGQAVTKCAIVPNKFKVKNYIVEQAMYRP